MENVHINYLSSSLSAGNVGMKSLDLGRGTSENHLCFRASSADIRCKRELSVLRKVRTMRMQEHIIQCQLEIMNCTLSGS